MTALNMRVSNRYGTHLGALLACLRRTTGPVLELGVGVFSTPILHYTCEHERRLLVSCETDPKYYAFGLDYAGGLHHVNLLVDWDEAPCALNWDVVLVDHSPSERRVVDIARMAQTCRYLVIHDTNGRYESQYHYSTVWPLFRWKWDDTRLNPSTTVVSNFEDLGDFTV